MKKIITALTVTAMALSAAFADVSLEFKQMAYILADDTTGDTGTLDLFTGYSSTSAGNLKFTAKKDNVGVEFTIKPTIDNSGKNNTIAWNNYYGWAKLLENQLEFRAGRWESRTVNRYNGFAGNYESNWYERYKPGTMTGNAKDINCLTSKELAAQLNYKLDGGMWVTGALIKSDYDPASGIQSKSGWAAEFGTTVGEGTTLIVDFKNLKQDQYAFAVFGRNTTLKEGLDFQAGVIFDRLAKASDNFVCAADFRAQYDLGDNLALITMNNLTYDAKNASTNDAAKFMLWDMVSLAVTATENATINLTVQWEHDDLMNADGNKRNTDGRVTLSPMVNYVVAKGVDFSAGMNVDITGWSTPSTTTFNIPFVFHVKM
ncbi:MAG: hypothetical protein IJP90_11485 [Treponema sp.]|nr:hypothetical protein [Treponema sp.]